MLTMPEVLNPQLYRRLKQYFGAVKVSNNGQAMIAKREYGVNKEQRLAFSQEGEYYLVNCPYCGDTRFRLYISHMFGKKDDWGRYMTFLAICFNEGCLNKRDNQERLTEIIEEPGEFLEKAPVHPGATMPEEACVVTEPGVCIRLDKLPSRHKARAYIESRGFDPDLLSHVYGVSYCESSHYYLASDRIIIPIFEGKELKGWQARYIGELAWKDKEQKRNLPPKYFSCPNSQFRSKCVYNFDRMREWETGIVVEGSTDAWRFGAMAGCIFGNSMTDIQKRNVYTVFRYRKLILLLDPEEFEKPSTKRTIKYFKHRMSGQFCAVKLPTGTDPGSLGRDFLRDFVREEAAKQNVEVTYKKHRGNSRGKK